MQNLIESLLKDKEPFQEFIEKCKKKKISLLNPMNAQKLSACAGVVSYINTLIERLEKGKIKL